MDRRGTKKSTYGIVGNTMMSFCLPKASTVLPITVPIVKKGIRIRKLTIAKTFAMSAGPAIAYQSSPGDAKTAIETANPQNVIAATKSVVCAIL